MLLSSYITQVQRLLHDSAAVFWQTSELTDYINEASAHVAADTGCLRALVTTLPSLALSTASWSTGTVTFTVSATGSIQVGASFTVTGVTPSAYNGTYTATAVTGTTVQALLSSNPGAYSSGGTLLANITTITGQEAYNFPTIQVTVSTNATPTTQQAVISLLGVTIIQTAVRYKMRYLPWTQFDATVRSWMNYKSLPIMSSIYNQNSMYLAPVPDQAYAMEWDVFYTPPTLVQTTDDDTLIYPYNGAVKYYAAYLAQLAKQRYQEAQTMGVLYAERINQIVDETVVRRIPNPYYR